MTDNPGPIVPHRFGPFELHLDTTLKPGQVGFRDADGTRRCAACGCREDVHCGVCGCRTKAGTRDECLCAKFVAHINTCPHCGTMYGPYHQLQAHLLPTPTCQGSVPRAAAGRYAEAPEIAPPLAAHRDRYMRA